MTAVDTRTLPTAPASRRFSWPAWGWSLIGVLAVWAVIIAVRPGSPFDPITQALSLAPFLVLVALGQMLVITLGPGNIDVSVGTVISMTSYVSVAIGATHGPAVGLLAAVVAGALAGAVSVAAILVLRVPPIIATLATSLIVTSATLLLADAARGGADPVLRAFVNAKVVGIPIIAIIVAAVTVLTWFVLRHTQLGLSIIAVGQSARAAERAGIKVALVTATAYLISAGFAGLVGGLLAAYISPSTVLGTSYMLDSIAVVVIGGTLISGGRPVPAGAWTGALFFVLLSGLLNLVGWSVGAQNVLKGVLVVLVVIVASAATGTGRSSIRRLRDSMRSRTSTPSTPSQKEPING
ncbi:Ribose import permease protein RbsC [Microbacterium oleivorans]|uniref:ABC transporter permease n=1 Tax=Microbacterium oleivorans TaxID=273677 RepID=UPI00097843FF|nr:ABC transporter permease [Microbacterium oleivorans]AZS44839.1 Ribose import permease protein RbsC [Microbacterium oleivorans]